MEHIIHYSGVDLEATPLLGGKGEKKTILSDVGIELGTGEFCYLIGKSGSGKTTLLRSLYGDYPIARGTATVMGTSLHALTFNTLPAFRRQVGMIFQSFYLFNDKTVRANLATVLRVTDWKDGEAIEKRIDEMLDRVGLLDKKMHLPIELSGGEQQRVAIARAILNKPKLIIADEPTGNLDPATSDAVLYLLRDLAEEYALTVVFATHDYRLLEKFPARVYHCKAGAVAEIPSGSIAGTDI